MKKIPLPLPLLISNMYQLVRKTLETYLSEQRVITLSDFPAELSPLWSRKDAIFVTLYFEGKVIASSGRIACQKENTLYECVDNTLLCLKDPRFTASIASKDKLSDIHIRTDRFGPEGRRILRSIDELDTTREGLIFLSQNLGIISVILPHMLHVDTSSQAYFALACKKSWIDPESLTPADFVLYGLTTVSESDFDN
jgi:AMMECR1 domain-containing protein